MNLTQKQVQAYAECLWGEYCEIFPKLVSFECPKIKLCGKMRKDAGECQQDENYVRLNKRMLATFQDTMLREIIPHELAHQIDYNFNGFSERACGHGMEWAIIMVKIGLPPKTHHYMDWKKCK